MMHEGVNFKTPGIDGDIDVSMTSLVLNPEIFEGDEPLVMFDGPSLFVLTRNPFPEEIRPAKPDMESRKRKEQEVDGNSDSESDQPTPTILANRILR